MIARRGADAFYRGRITEDIVNELRREGVPITYEDFEDHGGEVIKPVKTTYDEFELYELPPNTQGLLDTPANKSAKDRWGRYSLEKLLSHEYLARRLKSLPLSRGH